MFFKVRYDLPQNCQAELSITDSDDNKWHGEKRVNRSGTYIFSTVAPDRKGAWASFSNGFKVRITPAGTNRRIAQGTLLCSIDLDMSLLSEKEREALTRRQNNTRAKFQKSRFEIAVTKRRPIPFTLNTCSTTIPPAKTSAATMATKVITGINAFCNTCIYHTFFVRLPLL